MYFILRKDSNSSWDTIELFASILTFNQGFKGKTRKVQFFHYFLQIENVIKDVIEFKIAALPVHLSVQNCSSFLLFS